MSEPGASYSVFSILIWLFNFATLVGIFLSTRYAFRARRPLTRAQMSEVRDLALDSLHERPPLSELVEAWNELQWNPGSISRMPDRQRMIALLCDGDQIAVRKLCEVEDRYLNAVNEPCALIDQGLLRPRDLLRRRPALHLQLIQQGFLVEPVILYQSIVHGRGRRGYRLLQLQKILLASRPLSPNSQVRGPLTLDVFGRRLAVADPVNSITRPFRIAWAKVHSPTINVRTKVEQKREIRELAQALGRAGYPALDFDHVQNPVVW
jgi:hypothetical protein